MTTNRYNDVSNIGRTAGSACSMIDRVISCGSILGVVDYPINGVIYQTPLSSDRRYLRCDYCGQDDAGKGGKCLSCGAPLRRAPGY